MPPRDRLTLLATLLRSPRGLGLPVVGADADACDQRRFAYRHYALLTFLMWFGNDGRMMTPWSRRPCCSLIASHGAPRAAERPRAHGCFVAGYLLVSLGFRSSATVLPVELIAAGWIDAMGVAARPWLTSGLLLAVGIYQWLPAKRACLNHCRSPAEFLVTAYRPGAIGALRMGLQHGLYCLGCCWALMLLLFVGGVMNLLWVAVIAAVVFAEKLFARGDSLRRLIGIAAVLAGVAVPVFHSFHIAAQ